MDTEERQNGSCESMVMRLMAGQVANDWMEMEAEAMASMDWVAEEAGVKKCEVHPPLPGEHPACPMCKERGQVRTGCSAGGSIYDLPKCAWRPPGPNTDSITTLLHPLFNPDNDDCAALSVIRGLAMESEVWSDEQHAAILPWDGRFLVVSYWKHRAQTEGLWVMAESHMRVARYEDVVAFLQWHRDEQAGRAIREMYADMMAQEEVHPLP